MNDAASITQGLSYTSCGQLTDDYRSGRASPLDATKIALARADAINPLCNAFSVIDHDGAFRAARASLQRWQANAPLSVLDGVPITIKDLVHTHGLDVRYGSNSTPSGAAFADSPVVARLRAAGAVILGLTTSPEFGWKAVTDSARNGITRNPWDREMTPGGSSGGAAVAAAADAGVLHLGTDGGGSIRIPASFCGIVGHKPTFGTVAAFPASAFGTVAHIGPMARTVQDVWAMLSVMAGLDARDWNQPRVEPKIAAPQMIDWKGRKIGYWDRPPVGAVDPEVDRAVRRVMSDLQAAGAEVEVITLPDQDSLLEVFHAHWHVGAAVRFAAVPPEFHDQLDPGFVKIAKGAMRLSSVDHMQAEIARAAFGAKMDALLQRYDLVMSPSVPILPFAAGRDVPENGGFAQWTEWSSFSFPINLSQQPACSVPCGRSESGLPIGLQIIGARYADAAVLSAALTVQTMYAGFSLLPGTKAPFATGGTP